MHRAGRMVMVMVIMALFLVAVTAVANTVITREDQDTIGTAKGNSVIVSILDMDGQRQVILILKTSGGAEIAQVGLTRDQARDLASAVERAARNM